MGGGCGWSGPGYPWEDRLAAILVIHGDYPGSRLERDACAMSEQPAGGVNHLIHLEHCYRTTPIYPMREVISNK